MEGDEILEASVFSHRSIVGSLKPSSSTSTVQMKVDVLQYFDRQAIVKSCVLGED